MTAIISGNTLGLINASLAGTGMHGGNPSTGRGAENVYVNAVTGNLVVQRQDELLAARGPDIGVLRTYNSQGQLDGDNNDNWRIGFHRQLRGLTGGIGAAGSGIVRVEEDGAEQRFSWDGSTYVSTDGDGAYDTLSYNNASGQWTHTSGDTRATETYDWNNVTGKLLQQADASGNTTSYTYNAAGLVTRATSANSSGAQRNYTDLAWDNAGNLQSVTSSAWDAASGDNQATTRVTYAYEAWSDGAVARNRLKAVAIDLTPANAADSVTYITSYTYLNAGSTLLASITQSDGSSLAFTYSNGRVACITDALGNAINYAYDTANALTTVTDALGNATVHAYDAAGRLTSISAPAINGVSAVNTFSWNANGDLAMVTDGEGKRVVMQYDANGNLTLQRDDAGNTVTRSYDGSNRLVTETVYLAPDPDGADPANTNANGAPALPVTTRHVHDAAGKSQLRFTISPEGRVTEYRYDGYGQLAATIEYRGNIYAGATATEGDLQAWVNAATTDRTQSLRTDYTYDFRGQLAASTTWGSLDASGNGMAGSGATTSFLYSPGGQLLQSIAPLGGDAQTTLYTYDGLGRLLSAVTGKTPSVLNATSSVYDDVGNRTTMTANNGLTTVSTFDNAGRLVSVLQTGSGVNAQTSYYYDAGNQLRMTRDANGISSWKLYDAAGHTVGEIDGNGSLTEYLYDRNDRLVKTIHYATAVITTQLTVNADGSPSAAALALTLADLRPAAGANQAAWNVYDAAGRLVKSVDAGGAVTENIYDGASRLTATIAYAITIDTATLPAQPTSAQVAPTPSAGSDRVTRHFHDNDGLRRGVLDAEGYLSEIVYDGAGRAWKTIAYATATSASLRAGGTLDQLRPAGNAADQISYALYDARGALSGAIDAEGYLTETSHDANGNTSRIRRYASALSGGTLAGIGPGTQVATVRPADSAQDRVQDFSYDAQNRLASSTDGVGRTSAYTYDAGGNLASTTVASGSAEARSTSSAYDALGRQISRTDGRGKTATCQYDALGNLA